MEVMMSKWKEYKIGELGTVITGKTPSKNNPKDWGSKMPFVTPSDYKYYRKYAQFADRNLSVEGINRLRKKILPKNSILVTCIGSDMGKVVMNKINVITNQQINSIISNAKIVNNDFLYYCLVSMYEILRIYGSDGTAVPIINKVDFENLETKIPLFPEQRAIASVLSSLDDKIDLLHRQNLTLEKMAETLFRQWFVEDAKEDWKEVLITELFEVKDGTHDSPKKKKIGKKLITSRHLKPNAIDFDNAYCISEEDYEAINKRSKVDVKDVLFSMIGTIGNIYIEESKDINYAIKNIGLFKTSQNTSWCYFTYLWLKSEFGEDFIHKNRSGSTQEYISLGSLRSIKFRIPSKVIVIEFNEKIKNYYLKIKNNQTQIRTLEKLRDTLLPKLMNGEVKVSIDG